MFRLHMWKGYKLLHMFIKFKCALSTVSHCFNGLLFYLTQTAFVHACQFDSKDEHKNNKI